MRGIKYRLDTITAKAKIIDDLKTGDDLETIG
jgi:hypothetical protein